MKIDLYNNVEYRRAISPVSVSNNTAQISQIIDTTGVDFVAFIIQTGSIADDDAIFTVLVEHGDQANLSDAVAVPDHDLVGTEAAAGFDFDDDDTVRKIGYKVRRQYVRITITPSGNSSAALLSCVAALSGHKYLPVASQADD